MIFKTAIAITTALLVTGCQSTSVGELYASARPANPSEKNTIIEGMRNFLHDPYTVRDVEISKVISGKNIGGSYRMLCVRGNAKNAFGGYTGKQTYLVYMGNIGQITMVDQGLNMSMVCPKLAFSAFPEAERRLRAL